MTRKHFRELARIMREYDAHPLLIREVADFCSSENSRFDRKHNHQLYSSI